MPLPVLDVHEDLLTWRQCASPTVVLPEASCGIAEGGRVSCAYAAAPERTVSPPERMLTIGPGGSEHALCGLDSSGDVHCWAVAALAEPVEIATATAGAGWTSARCALGEDWKDLRHAVRGDPLPYVGPSDGSILSDYLEVLEVAKWLEQGRTDEALLWARTRSFAEHRPDVFEAILEDRASAGAHGQAIDGFKLLLASAEDAARSRYLMRLAELWAAAGELETAAHAWTALQRQLANQPAEAAEAAWRRAELFAHDPDRHRAELVALADRYPGTPAADRAAARLRALNASP
jgi:hypothetical protein